ncbi:MAG: polysaccharide deacetylase family protein [Sphingomonadales bacterium]|nr:polysaccharide deacetylase family protein [Sphingomonadales bacterium]NCQ22046.1 polysaccharide deacetylase family protein [Sphingomonadales bacterium]NCT03685.1 polysaccharide deacetylase family protein [Sphingomonadales bacterium]
MTRVFITIDTEYSSGLYTGPGAADRADNFARSIACITPQGPAGIAHKLDLLNRYGQKAVFFVDPMPALVWGVAAIEDIVGPILAAGQDVQLHCHTEWLALAGSANPLASKATGTNLADFPFEEQCAILEFARAALMAAGAPAPIAFRAGNYGANDDTLRALASMGIAYDTSHCPALVGRGACRIGLGQETRDPVGHMGVLEVPIGAIGTLGGGLRHAQITALTLREMLGAVRHARDARRSSFTVVSHSFELINRRTMTVNHIVRRRFAGLVRNLATMRGVTTGSYAEMPPALRLTGTCQQPLPATAMRTGMRMAEQLVSNALYGAI